MASKNDAIGTDHSQISLVYIIKDNYQGSKFSAIPAVQAEKQQIKKTNRE